MNGKDAEGADSAENRGDCLKSKESQAVLLHRQVTAVILGAFYAVHSELGHGFLEVVYANALTVLLGVAGLRVEREVPFDIVFHSHTVGRYRADLIVESKVVVEVKAGRAVDPTHAAQLLNYLRASRLEVGCCSISVRRLSSGGSSPPSAGHRAASLGSPLGWAGTRRARRTRSARSLP